MTPPSLTGPDLAPLWQAVRERLERRGSASRGRLTTPALSTVGRHLLSSLLDRSLTATVDLSELERALVRVGVGRDLVEALEALGYAMSFDQQRKRAERQVAKAARETVRAATLMWPEVWASYWADEVIQAGLIRQLDPTAASTLVANVRRCLDALSTDDQPTSRVDLAAKIVGDSHALDVGSRLGAAMTRALRQRFMTELHDETDRNVWERAGAPSDSVSAPALTWNLPVAAGSDLAPMINTATSIGVVLHLSQMAAQRYALDGCRGVSVLVTENPRIVEAAAQRGSAVSVVSTNGNPSTAVRLVLWRLLESGADVRYHGDFDAAGLSICRRMVEFGLRPWQMDVAHYEAAIAEAEAAGVDLPIDKADPGATPWDEPLREVFRHRRLVVHEERVLEALQLFPHQ